MFKGWFSQGVVTNIVSAFIVAGGGIAMTVLAQRASPLAVPILYGLGTSGILSVIVLSARNGLLRGTRTKATTRNAKTVIRDWLDKSSIEVKNSPIDGWDFNYLATIDGKKINIGQHSQSRSYLSIAASVTFSEDDRRALESAQGGILGTVKLLRITLAAAKVTYAGLGIPLSQVHINKRLFIGEGILEHELHEAVLEVECGVNITLEIASIPAAPSQ